MSSPFPDEGKPNERPAEGARLDGRQPIEAQPLPSPMRGVATRTLVLLLQEICRHRCGIPALR